MAEPAAPAVLLAQAWELACVDPVRAAVPARLLAASSDTLAPWGWWHLAFAEMRIGKLASGVAALTQAEHGFAASGDLRGQRFVREAQAIRLRREERAAEALALQAQIDSEMGGEQSSLDLYIAHSSRALTYRDLGRADDALRHLHAARDAAEASGNAGARITALGNLGSCHLELYNLDDAREMSLQAFSAALGAGSPHNLLAVTANLVLTHYALGEHRQAHAMAQFLTDHPDELPPDALERGRTAIALGHLAVGEVDEAVAWLERGEHCPVADREGVTLWTWLHMRCSLARGDAAAARALGERTLAERARLGLGDGPFDLMELHRALADACEGLGDTPAALACVRRAQSLYEQLVGRSARARRITLQVGCDLALAQRERDRAVDSRRAAEADRQRLADLNTALERQIAENRSLQARLTEQALRDPLTGLHNRRFLFESAPGLFELARRQGSSLAVALLDLDHFKLLNDTYGHQTGDSVLQRFADVLVQALRKSDIVCRHGGEEFVVLMPDVGRETARAVLERVLDTFGQLPAELSGRRRVPSCTFSAGISMFPSHGNTLEQLLSRADRALYRAKQHGRSRIEEVPGTSFATLP